MKRAALALLLVVLVVTGRAAAQPVQIAGRGSAMSCGTWLETRRSNVADMLPLNWALGYISGAATWGDIGDPLRGTDAGGVAYWIDNWCRSAPSRRFVDAVRAFIAAHRPHRR